MTDLIIGCPVWMRGWVLADYFSALEVSCFNAGFVPQFIFVSDPRDVSSQRVINGYATALKREVAQVWIEEDRTADRREWNDDRYHRMVYLRNLLLQAVRQAQPALFLSLDSDILLHPLAIKGMLDGLEHYDAVGGKCYMTIADRNHPSMGYIDVNGQFYRNDCDGFAPVDVIMAVKLMTPLAYNVDYEWHTKGEDIGWSIACKRADLRLGFDGRFTSKHVMDESMLARIDVRCGF